MSATNTSSERTERLRQLYNADVSSPASASTTTAQLVAIVDDVMLLKNTPKAAAEKAASLIQREQEPEKAYQQLLNFPHCAAVQLEDETKMQKLVDFMTALANLPDAINQSSEPMTAETYNPEVKGGTLTFQPGEAIVFENGVLWKDLPDWSMMITETHQGWTMSRALRDLTDNGTGPEQWLTKHRGKDDEPTATQKWKDFNTYLALFVASPEARATPALSHLSWLGLKTLAIILESSHDAWNFHEELWTPAGKQWMRIAGDELARVCAGGQQKYPPGELWKAEGGGDVCDEKRFAFWKERAGQKGW